MSLENTIEQVKNALACESNMRKCLDSALELSDGTMVASLELCKGKVDALTESGYKTLDDMELAESDWSAILSAI